MPISKPIPKPRLASLLLIALLSPVALAQRPPAPTLPPLPGSLAEHPIWPTAQPSDVQSIDAIVSALYDVISGPRGQARDWNRMRSLFLPDAHLVPARAERDPHRADAVMLTIDGYIQRATPATAANGFFEHGIHNQVEEFGSIAHVWSTYETRHASSDARPFTRGINSIQLLKSGGRYYIVEVLWDAETTADPLPPKYLPK